MTYENYETKISVSHSDGNITKPIELGMISDCFGTIMARVKLWWQKLWPVKPKIFTLWSLQKMFANFSLTCSISCLVSEKILLLTVLLVQFLCWFCSLLLKNPSPFADCCPGREKRLKYWKTHLLLSFFLAGGSS